MIKSDTQTKEADNKMYELSSEDDVWTIKSICTKKGCSETDFFLRTRQEHLNVLKCRWQQSAICDDSRNADVSTVESDMKEEVQYLYTANSDDTIPAMDTQSSEYNGKNVELFFL